MEAGRAADERAHAARAEREQIAEREREQAAHRAAREATEAADRQAAEVAAAAEASRLAAERAAQEATARQAAEVAAAEEASRRAAAAGEQEAAARQAADVAAVGTPASATVSDAHVPPPLRERPAATLPHESVFVPWTPGPKGGRIVLDKLDVATNRRLVNAALVEGINAEGPIHIERLARLIAASFEVRKLSPGRVTDIAAVIPKSTVRTEDGTVCWPARVDPVGYEGFRSSPEPELRPTEHIPRHELANAMRDVVTLQGPTAVAEVFGITRRIFGGKRVTANVEARMAAALDEAVTEGRLARDGDIVSVG
ncbi:hypothetical protein [Nakamurella deserti]|uniref:hypothetical protein n=1 Tax=Nakamurella deserti TaxID=2164074 RepID=UPI0013008233|nr:hypothetical protein [Nakamurella deserti]